jgi:outer membrane protein assembly factor BamB
LAYRRLQQWRGKLELPAGTVNAALALLVTACAVTFRDVPRAGINEVREYLGTPTRTPAQLEHLDSVPQLAWAAPTGRGVTGAAAVGERVTIITSVDRWVYALDTRSGELFWRYRGQDAYGVGAAMGGGAVYVATETGEGFITAIDLFSGKRRWQMRVGLVSAPMVLRDSTLYAVNNAGLLLALDTRTGATRWSRVAGSSRAGPLVTTSFIAVPALSDSLFVFAVEGGRPLTRAPLPRGVTAPLAMITDSLAAAASPAGGVFAVRLPQGSVAWTVDTGDPVPGAPSVHGDTVFAITNACGLWQVPTAAPGSAAPLRLPCRTRTGATILRDGVLVATVAGDLLFHERSGTARQWKVSVGGDLRHPPIVQHGQIVIAPVLGDVVSFR